MQAVYGILTAHQEQLNLYGLSITGIMALISLHHSQMMSATIENMLRTVPVMFSNSDLKSVHEIQMTSRIALSNGYPEQSLTKSRRTPATPPRHQSDNKFSFKVPFDSDDFGIDMRNCIRKAGLDSMVPMNDVPPANLKAAGLLKLAKSRGFDIDKEVELVSNDQKRKVFDASGTQMDFLGMVKADVRIMELAQLE
ncbi:unnamed protein product [Heligmosomoides polygyrus]|uniref:Anaphase-promoting complex subunit 13 n=1 Tax=Heligmosomoides polygyrus TaxID=6339 RepID=A0A183FL13_HELPZ|nr:unnamed protein product [Heligmosomoides polygyrus]